MLVRIALSIWLLVLSMTSFAMADNADAIVGLWNTPGNEAQFEIYKYNALYCGRIVYLEEPDYPEDDDEGMAGLPKIDRNNPDTRLKNRPLLGLTLLQGLRYEGDNTWHGKVYDPEGGGTYNCRITLSGRNQLKLRGYIGISLLGRTETWTRQQTEPSR